MCFDCVFSIACCFLLACCYAGTCAALQAGPWSWMPNKIDATGALVHLKVLLQDVYDATCNTPISPSLVGPKNAQLYFWKIAYCEQFAYCSLSKPRQPMRSMQSLPAVNSWGVQVVPDMMQMQALHTTAQPKALLSDYKSGAVAGVGQQ